MIRKRTLFSLTAAAVGGGMLFVVAHEAQQRERELDRISQSIREAREAVVVLEAEWAYLNQLDRLQQLSARHLGLTPMMPSDVVRIRDLPMRIPAERPPDGNARPPLAGSRGPGERGR